MRSKSMLPLRKKISYLSNFTYAYPQKVNLLRLDNTKTVTQLRSQTYFINPFDSRL